MNIPIIGWTLTPGGSWSLSWGDAGAAYYRIVLYGRQLGQTAGLSYTYAGGSSSKFPPPLEVSFEDELVASEEFKPYVQIQWWGNPAAASYLVQLFSGGSWQTVQKIQQSGQSVYTYQSPTLVDGQVAQFQVVATDNYGNQSTPIVFNCFIVAPPPPPDQQVVIGYGGGSLVVTPAPS